MNDITVVAIGILIVAGLCWIAFCLKVVNENLATIGRSLFSINNNLAGIVDLKAGTDPQLVRKNISEAMQTIRW